MAMEAEKENVWDVEGFEMFIAPDASSRCSSTKPPLPLRPAMRNDMMNLWIAPRKSVPAPSSDAKRQCIEAPGRYFEVVYGVKRKNSKKYTSRFDGVLALHGSSYTLFDSEAKSVHKGRLPGAKDIKENSELEISKYSVEVMNEVSEEDYKSGQVFTSIFPQLSTVSSESGISSASDGSSTRPTLSSHPISVQDALILNPEEAKIGAEKVIVDPYISSKLRPHQKEGVKFMYECVMGLRQPGFSGCLLADEMGLGKTIQVIALIWTLLRQGPRGFPVIKRAVVICPSTLVQNWGKEVRKWLGTERLKPLVLDSCKEANQRLVDFKNDNFCPLLITSYETLRRHQNVIASSRPELLICDEAHRLKSCKGNKTIASLLSLKCNKRILLTGTPVQNNLSEFYALMDFANPNILGSYSEFKNVYDTPIERSRDRNARGCEKELGEERSKELKRRTSFCILRRTADVNMKYLPPKTEYVVFCKLQMFQVILYEIFLKSQFVRTLLTTDTPAAHVFTAILALRKLCNHPGLLQADMKYVTSSEIKNHPRFDAAKDALDFHGNEVAIRDNVKRDCYLSGKFICLKELLSVAIEYKDRIVVASNFTHTLDLIQRMCDDNGWRCVRLDGTTVISGRQSVVERFNRKIGGESIFLLSSKAGGTGLNLIGANRLVLVDPDWNPAIDFQAMGRVWREGQQKPVVIYRLLSTGSIEEKIYQRQIMKTDVTSVVGGHHKLQLAHKDQQNFSRSELKEIFSLHPDTECETFDLLSRANANLEDKWRDASETLDDPVLQKVLQSGVISFVSTDSTVTSPPKESLDLESPSHEYDEDLSFDMES